MAKVAKERVVMVRVAVKAAKVVMAAKAAKAAMAVKAAKAAMVEKEDTMIHHHRRRLRPLLALKDMVGHQDLAGPADMTVPRETEDLALRPHHHRWYQNIPQNYH
ncbi:hypothetical protein GGF43_001774 [Coemansia sp. RSA 2618]|nr:hypothetical protein GGF43_001774 [Coemansia sp. RSA 2618]